MGRYGGECEALGKAPSSYITVWIFTNEQWVEGEPYSIPPKFSISWVKSNRIASTAAWLTVAQSAAARKPSAVTTRELGPNECAGPDDHKPGKVSRVCFLHPLESHQPQSWWLTAVTKSPKLVVWPQA